MPFAGDLGFTRGDGIVMMLTCFHVPTFLLVSGILYATPGAIGWRTVGARLWRLLPPYLVATFVAGLTGVWRPTSARRLLFGVLTGSAVGTYYFIVVLAGCIAILPVLSRLRRRAALALLAVLAVYAEAAWMHPAWRVSDGFFWGIRDPLLQFHLGHFVLGLLVGRSLHEIARLHAHLAPVLRAGCGLGIASFVWLALTESAWTLHPLVHTAYMVSVVGAIASLAPARPAPRAVRFLSDATLTIYLYHTLLHPWLMPRVLDLPPLFRIALMTSVGLAVGALVAIVGRRIFGTRSRLLAGC